MYIINNVSSDLSLNITFGHMYIMTNVLSDLFLNITFGHTYIMTNVLSDLVLKNISENLITQFEIGKQKRGKKILR